MAADGSHRDKPDDAALWAAVTRGVKPLAGGRRRLAAGTAETSAPPPEGRPEAGGDKPDKAPPQPPGSHRQPGHKAPPPLAPGRSAGLDRRSAERLRRGKLSVEARLDLHGMTQQAAHAELSRFLAESESRGRRCVLVVTGKGRGGEDARGVLRRQVPLWLNEPPNRARILAFAHAQPRDGGTGALYVLLRRRREAD